MRWGYDWIGETDSDSVMSVGVTFGGTVITTEYKFVYYDFNFAVGAAGTSSTPFYRSESDITKDSGPQKITSASTPTTAS